MTLRFARELAPGMRITLAFDAGGGGSDGGAAIGEREWRVVDCGPEGGEILLRIAEDGAGGGRQCSLRLLAGDLVSARP